MEKINVEFVNERDMWNIKNSVMNLASQNNVQGGPRVGHPWFKR